MLSSFSHGHCNVVLAAKDTIMNQISFTVSAVVENVHPRHSFLLSPSVSFVH